MKEDISKAFTAATSTAPTVLNQFATEKLQQIASLQRDLFHCIELYVENRAAILPGLAVEMYDKGEEAAEFDLRILRDDFPRLRDLYIASFEASHHALDFVMGLENIGARRDPNVFPPSGPKNLKAFLNW